MSEPKQTLAPEEYFSHKVREVIRQKGLRRDDVAEALGISTSRFNSYLRNYGAVLPQIVTAVDIANYLGVSLDYLCGTGMVKEQSVEQKLTPAVLLTNLYRATHDAGFHIQTDGSRTTLTSDNYFVSLFLSQAANMTSMDEVRRLAGQYKDLHVVDHEIVHQSVWEQYHSKDAYIYRDMSEEQQRNFPDECANLIEKRKQEWDRTDGHPEQYFPEGWE